MEHTVSLKLNHVFRRLYGRGKSAVNPCLAVYCRKNNLGYSRLGLTVGGVEAEQGRGAQPHPPPNQGGLPHP